MKIFENKNRTKLFYTVLSSALFLAASFTLWNFLYKMCNLIGSIVEGVPAQTFEELKSVFPLMLGEFFFVVIGTGVFDIYRAGSSERRSAVFERMGIKSILIGGIISIYVIMGILAKLYARPVEGYPTLFFPLDIAFGGIIIIIFGILCRKYSTRQNTEYCGIYIKGNFRFFHNLSYLVSLCGFAACVYGIFCMDWSHGAIFYNIMLLLNYFTAFLMFVIYRFVYAEAEEEKRGSIAIKYGVIFLVLNIILFALYSLSVDIYNEAPCQNAFSILPVSFTASISGFTVIYALNNICAPLAALIFGIKTKKQN